MSNVHFYSSDAKDTSIISYGDTAQENRHFKITYKDGRYTASKKIDGKYWKLAEKSSLDEAILSCTINAKLSYK